MFMCHKFIPLVPQGYWNYAVDTFGIMQFELYKSGYQKVKIDNSLGEVHIASILILNSYLHIFKLELCNVYNPEYTRFFVAG